MASESGYSNQKKLGISQFKTIHNVGSDKYGQSVASKALYEKTPEEAIAATEIIGKSGQIEFLNIYYPAHNALVNDVFRMTVGAYTNFEFDVLSIIDVDNFLVLPLLPAIDISGDSGIIMGWVTNKTNFDGTQIVTISPSPVKFIKDSNVVDVNEDTITPANNVFLPVKDIVAQASLSSIDGKFTTLNAKDFATETTLAGIAALDFATATQQSDLFYKTPSAIVTVAHDEIVTTYVGATTDINTVVYKEAGNVVSTLTFSYDGSNRLIGVVRS